MKLKKLLGIVGFCTLILLPISSKAASSGMAIGYNPADFTVTINGKSLEGEALTNMLVTSLFEFRCSDDSDKSYEVVESENPRVMKILEKEIKLSNSIYADPATRLTPNIIVATHLTKGDLIVENGRTTVNLRIEDRQGNMVAQSKMSGSESSFYDLIKDATKSLADQICKPDPKKPKKDKENNETKIEQQEMDACTRLWKAYYDCIGDTEKDAQGYAKGISCGQHYLPLLKHCDPTAVTLKAVRSKFDDMPDPKELEVNFQKFLDMLNGKNVNELDNAKSDAEFEQMVDELEMYTK